MQLKAGRYVVIPSTFDPGFNSRFFLRVYSTSNQITLTPLPNYDESAFQMTVLDGEWNDLTAGGCHNTPKWMMNPQYSISVQTNAAKVPLTVVLKQQVAKPFHICSYVIRPTEQQQVFRTFELKEVVASGSFVPTESCMCNADIYVYIFCRQLHL